MVDSEFVSLLKKYALTIDPEEKMRLKEGVLYESVPKDRRKDYLISRGYPEVNSCSELLAWIKKHGIPKKENICVICGHPNEGAHCAYCGSLKEGNKIIVPEFFLRKNNV